jgi:hypothetical protein
MSERPRIEPGLIAAITAGAPARLQKALDKDPQVAERWTWEATGNSWGVTTESGETVELRPDAGGNLTDAGQIQCSCLLAPRCLHLMAVLSRLPLGEGSTAAAAAPAADPAPADGATAPLAGEQARAALALEQGAGQLLEVGASAAGVRLQADLLRAVHDCRCAGLHRAAGAGTRLVRGIRDLLEARPEFRLGTYAADLLELLEVTAALRQAADAGVAPAVALLGHARRAYHELGNLRLHGIFCEPVLAGSGAAGVQTTLCGSDGRLYTVSDVQPGDPGRARATYERGVRLGETSLSHRELCREGLFVQGATVSADGRLGSGAGVKAVRAEAVPWDAEPVASLFAVPIAEQLRRAYAALALPVTEQPAGSSLLFLRGKVLAAAGPALLITLAGEQDELVVRCLPAHDHAELGIQSRLVLLARAPGLELKMIGRLRPEQPRSLTLLAIGPWSSTADVALELPAGWKGRCNLGLDVIQASHLRGLLGRPVEVRTGATEVARPDPLAPIRRRWQRLALGGRPTLPPEAQAALEREARWLEQRMLRTGAQLLRDLLGGALAGERTLTGERRRVDPASLARAYLAAGLYQRACAHHLEEQSWLDH